MTKLDKARQAFQERYGVTPEERGFVIIQEFGNKIVFSKSSEALAAFKKGEDLKRDSLKALFVTSFLTLLVWCFYLFFMRPNEADTRFGFLVIMLTWSLIMLGVHSSNEEKCKRLKETWEGEIIFYDSYENRLVEP